MQRMLKISGRVQGVGYRYWAQRTAVSMGLGGWVCNLPDDSVQCLVQGEPDQVEAFIKLVWQGPSAAAVDAVEELPVAYAAGEWKDFLIARKPL